MTSTNKVWTLTFTILLLTNLMVLTVISTNVQATPKPSVPQFSVKLIDKIFSDYVIDRSIEVTIKNQPFTSYTDANSNAYNLYYTIQYRINFSDDQYWGEITPRPLVQSDSQYTVVQDYFWGLNQSAVGSQMEFRVKAETGYLKETYNTDGYMVLSSEFVLVTSSGWSSVQTVTATDGIWSVPPSQTNSSPNLTATLDNNRPQQSEQTSSPSFVFHQSFLLWIGALLFVGVVITVVIVFTKRQLRTSTYNKDFTN